jgi:hypothetical protein
MKITDISVKNKKYLKAKIEELETNSKIKNIRDLYRGVNDLKKGYQPKTNEVSNFITELHSMLGRWSNPLFRY